MFAVHLAARLTRPLLPVHDVATAYGEDTPAFLRDRRPGGPQLAPLTRAAYFDVRPVLVASDNVPGVYAVALETARAMGWEVELEEAPSAFQAVVTTRLMRFRDDIVVRVKPDEAGGATRVDARSRSRMGQGDLGANGARLARYLARLRRDLAARQLVVSSRL
ncbi:hypothetical protein Rsub_11437 [Raphidocelis subcapitata]|uniref:DUF1499 domain-containing protein n=1 Tax=Raphidocelis subcapitata TaxID=307507 RepID=A0A2V0PMV5_9CHLO|nr:hypothetical protein Rsub_11437 [Raphidocelis subcapitata]|eukprot:GBF99230.1 hypothetical protein Rsub_11437 [Raphidocelis subcapitata]